MNDIIIDVGTSTVNKNLESITMNKLLVANMNNEKNLGLQYNYISLLEPD
jgi:hypothetical protein